MRKRRRCVSTTKHSYLRYAIHLLAAFFFFKRIRRPPRSPLFPSPTLSRFSAQITAYPSSLLFLFPRCFAGFPSSHHPPASRPRLFAKLPTASRRRKHRPKQISP